MNSSLSNIVTPLLNWYHTYARTLPWRQSPSAYHIWVSEIMLQQTRVEAVKAYYNRFTAELPTIADLAACQEEKLRKPCTKHAESCNTSDDTISRRDAPFV